MKILILGVSLNNPNRGVGALATGAVKCILHRWPQAQVVLLDYGKTPQVQVLRLVDRWVSIPVVNMRFSWRLYLRNNVAFLIFLCLLLKLIPIRSLRHGLTRRIPCLRELADADLVVAMTGGDSFSDVYGLERLAYGALPQILAVLAGKELVLLPQTLGPFRSRLARLVARYILRHAARVDARDRRSLSETVSVLGFNSAPDKFRFGYDVGFVVDPIAPARVEIVGLAADRREDGCRIGLNVSGLLAIGGYTRINMFGLRVEYNLLVRRLIGLFTEREPAEVLLVPHVFGQRGESDAVVCERIFQELRSTYPDRLGCLRGDYDQSEIKHIIGGCDFFVGSRMHACIAALSQGIPAVAIAYTDKFAGVFETVGMEGCVADARTLSEDGILSLIDQRFHERAALRRSLEAAMPRVKESVLRILDEFGSVETVDSMVAHAG